jgi:hypothetical protein
MRIIYSLIALSVIVVFVACKKEVPQTTTPGTLEFQGKEKSLNPFLEDTELGTKGSYAIGNVTLSTGSWSYNEALIGNSASDKKNGIQSARVRNSGTLKMLTDKANGAGVVSISHATYGTDAAGTWQLWYSTNAGSAYSQAGGTINALTGALQVQTFTLNVTGSVRLEIRKTDGSTNRINFDDVAISDYTGSNPPPTTKKFLFDAKHAQTAGNADWVIDQDNSTVIRFPTPAQSNVTATTSENFWTGAISSWGIALAKLGHTVESLTSSGSITYGNSTNAQDLSNYNVFIVDEPNTIFTAAEKTAMLQFVQNGGGLFIIADHTLSDRNNDGIDSPAIWNNFMSTNSVQANPFGFSFNLLNLTGTTSNITTTANPVITGSQGTVASIEFNNGTSMTMTPAANASVTGLIWKTAVTKNNSNVFCLSSTFGSGRVVAIGDSSPMDDGSGNPSDVLFPGWTTLSHSKLMMNASLWLAGL